MPKPYFNNMDKELIKAYQITIKDFETDLRHTEWWRFKRQKELREKIEYFEAKIVALYDN